MSEEDKDNIISQPDKDKPKQTTDDQQATTTEPLTTITVYVKSVLEGDDSIKIVLPSDATVSDLKLAYEDKRGRVLSMKRQQLTYQNKKLDNDRNKLTDYGITNGANISVTFKMTTGTSDDEDKMDVIHLRSIKSTMALLNILSSLRSEKSTSSSSSSSSTTYTLYCETETAETQKTRQKMEALKRQRKFMRSRSAPCSPAVRSVMSSPKLPSSPRVVSEPPSPKADDKTLEEKSMEEEDESFLMDHKYDRMPQQTVTDKMTNKALYDKDSKLFFEAAETQSQLDNKILSAPAENLKDLFDLRGKHNNSSSGHHRRLRPLAKSGKKCSNTQCSRRLDLTDISTGRCRCKGLFCSRHRNPEAHQCKYDFKTEGKQKLAKENPAIGRDKGLKKDKDQK